MKKINAFIKHIFGDKWVTDLAVEILGSMLVAIGITSFAVPAGFLMTGFSGIALIIYRLFSWNMGLFTVLMNIPVAIICYRLIGRKFFMRSIRCMLIGSLLIDYVAPLIPAYDMEGGSALVAAICCGVLCGLGYGMIYMRNTTTGGTDFIVMAVKSRLQHLPIGTIMFILDGLVVVGGGLILHNFDGIVYGLMVNFTVSFMTDRMMSGFNSGRLAMIVTDFPREVCAKINEVCERGTTILPATGGYTDREHNVVMCACSPRDIVLVEDAVKSVDPKAFTVVLESSEVLGYGFENLKVAENEAKTGK